MEVIYMKDGTIRINGAKLTHRNFEGRKHDYNVKGQRNFSVIINSEELAEDLIKEGWKIKSKPPKEEGDRPFTYMPVNIFFNDFGPDIFIESGDNVFQLYEDTVHRIDKMNILDVDLHIRPNNWEINGKTGRSAYLNSIWVRQNVSIFASRYNDFMRGDKDYE